MPTRVAAGPHYSSVCKERAEQTPLSVGRRSLDGMLDENTLISPRCGVCDDPPTTDATLVYPSSACFRSLTRSDVFSMPADTRIVFSEIPAARRASGVIDA